MSTLKIFTNYRNEIKALRYTNDESLRCHEIDREKVFGNVSDAIILGYKYEPQFATDGTETTPIVTPYLDLAQLRAIEAGLNQIINQSTNIIHVNEVTLEELIVFHKKALNNVMQTIVFRGIDVDEKHYSLTEFDQKAIDRWVTKLETHPEISYVAYHADGSDCTMITREEMLKIGAMAEAFVFFHTTRINQLHRLVESCKRKRDVLAIQYNTELPKDFARKVEELYLSMGISGTLRDYMYSTITDEKVEGEIYTNAGSMIEPESYNIMPDWCDFSKVTVEKLAGNDNTLYRYIIPVKIVDDDKVSPTTMGHRVGAFALSAIFNELVPVGDGNGVAADYNTLYTAVYRFNAVTKEPEIYMDIHNNITLQVDIPLASLVHSVDDTVNPKTRFYIINDREVHTILTEEQDSDVMKHLGVKEDNVFSYE